MPDITMCDNKECYFAHDCYRFMAKPDEWRQSFATFSPWPLLIDGKPPCFAPIANWVLRDDDRFGKHIMPITKQG